MDLENKCETITEQYKHDIQRFSQFHSEYDEISFESEHNNANEEWKRYTSSIELIKALDDHYGYLSEDVKGVYCIELLNNALTALRNFYCFHKTILVDFDRKRLDNDLLDLQLLYRFQHNEVIDFQVFEYSEENIEKTLSGYDNLLIKGKTKFGSNLKEYIYSTDTVSLFKFDQLEDEDYGLTDEMKDRFADVFFKIKKDIYRSGQIITQVQHILLMQLIRMIRMFIYQIENAEEEPEPPVFYEPLFEKEIELFKQKDERIEFSAYDEVVSDVIFRLEKAKGLNVLSDQAFDKVWDYYTQKLNDTELGRLWDEVANEKGLFALSLYKTGCKYKDLLEYFKVYFALEYLKESKVEFEKGHFSLEKRKPVRKRDKYFAENEVMNRKTTIIINIADFLKSEDHVKIFGKTYNQCQLYKLFYKILCGETTNKRYKQEQNKLWNDFLKLQTSYNEGGIKLNPLTEILGAMASINIIESSPTNLSKILFSHRGGKDVNTLRSYIQMGKKNSVLAEWIKEVIDIIKI